MRCLPTLALVCCACAAPEVPISTVDRPPTIRPALGATPVGGEGGGTAARSARGAQDARGRLAELREPPAPRPGPDAFAYWDRDADGVLSADELTDVTVAAWDENGDGVVDRREWPG